MNMIKFVILVVVLTFASWTIINAYAYAIDGSDNVGNLYFSVNIPDSWTYQEVSNTLEARTQGMGPLNGIELTPSEFSDFLLMPFEKYMEKIQDGGAGASFDQDIDYRLKNAPLESYVKYKIDKLGILNITSQHYTIVGKEKAVRIDTNDMPYSNTMRVQYFVMHDKQPYSIGLTVNAKDYEKYLPAFEQMVKSFRFVDFPSKIENSDNENITNTATNFSGANLSELSSRDSTLSELSSRNTNDTKLEELYNECVNVSGQSLCDFLFKR